jgi:molybdopterin converting factor small subunit
MLGRLFEAHECVVLSFTSCLAWLDWSLTVRSRLDEPHGVHLLEAVLYKCTGRERTIFPGESVAGRATVTVEFFGIPRQRAGRAELVVQGESIAEVLAAVRQACPHLADLVAKDGRLAAHYLLSIDGIDFVADLRQRLAPDTRILLLSADAGG